MQFDKGFISPYFVTDADRQGKLFLKIHTFLLLIQKITAVNDRILPILEKVIQFRKTTIDPIAEDIEGEALATLVVNKIAWNL